MKGLFTTLGKILRHMSVLERITVLILGAVFVASTFKVIFPAFTIQTPQIGNTVYAEGLVGYPRLINPVFTDFNEIDRDLSQLVFSGLLKYDPEIRNFVPDLAQEVKRSENNLSYAVTLRQDVFWHDGSQFSSDDVVFTFQKVIQDPGFKNPVLRTAFQNITVEKIDDYNVVFRLDQPNSFFPSYLITGILPFHELKETSIVDLDKSSFNRNPIGTGPYKLRTPITSSTPDALFFEQFNEYYGDKSKFNIIRTSFYSSADALLKETSKFNVIPKIQTSENITELIDTERLKISEYILPQYTAIFFNLDRELTEENRLREAIFLSLDKDALAELLGDVRAIDTLAFDRNPENGINNYDIDAARELVSRLGYKEVGDDGLARNSKDETLDITILAREFPEKSSIEERTARTVNFLKTSLHDTGINLNVRRENAENFNELLSKRDYDMVLAGHSIGHNTDAFAFWHSTQGNEYGLNFSQLKSFQVDSILEDLRLITNWEHKRSRLDEFEGLIEKFAPAIFLYTPRYYYISEKSLGDINTDGLAFASDRFANLHKIVPTK
jgi:peptide/nickel transport system substrate-binding protein